MCNIAGYVGTKRAAPILIEMLRAQEGLNAGFYTGIATLHEGKIHYRKLVGDLDTLLQNTDAADLPGNIGIIHSRTPGPRPCEGDEWAHPFVSRRAGEVTCAMVLNGTVGYFKPLLQVREKFAHELLATGAEFPSRTRGDGGIQLGDGTCVHSSDVICQLAARHMDGGDEPRTALANTFCEYSEEAVVLMLCLQRQDAIAWARMNFPMHVAFAEHGAYLATAPMAIPADAGAYHLLPLLSSGYVRKDGFDAAPFPARPARIAELTPTVRARIYAAICGKLKEGEQTVEMLAEVVRPLFEPADCAQVGAAIYEVLCDLDKQGLLQMRIGRVPGQFEGLTAPLSYMKL